VAKRPSSLKVSTRNQSHQRRAQEDAMTQMWKKPSMKLVQVPLSVISVRALLKRLHAV
jgi:hypothetical protein